MKKMTPRRAFTIVDLAALMLVATAGAAALVVLQPEPPRPAADPTDALRKARAAARQAKDQVQLRAITQSLVIWAQNNNDRYPLPSRLDAGNATVNSPAPEKDTSAAVFSILIFIGLVSPEMCVSPAESNPSIKVAEDYQFDRPKTAADPERALWDPSFSADFTEGKTGNLSFAHLQPAGGRRAHWARTDQGNEGVVANRSPKVLAVDDGPGGKRVARPADGRSNTFLIHGEPDRWEGHVAFNDGHVEFLTTLDAPPTPEHKDWRTFTVNDRKVPDSIFFDEPEDESRSNTFLGIFVTSGRTPADFKGIWD